MGKLKHLASGRVYDVAREPVYASGTWQCGDANFYDPSGVDYQPLPPVPFEVTMRQARVVLIEAGLDTAIDAAIAAISDAVQRKKAQAEWEYSNTVQRHGTLVSTIGAALGLSEAAIDALFVAAAAIPA